MKFSRNFKVYYNKVTESIAFYPAIIAVGFLFLSWGMLELDFSTWGKQLKSGTSWISLKDASTARTIVSTVAAAIISLTVFSFSMVMIVLNQAASQMSNRVLTSMIENRFQQMILGFYIGTIVYALFLLSTIRDISSGIYVPALSIYLLILLTVVDIFLFIYFLDYVTQTVKHETVIHRVQNHAMKTMKNWFLDEVVEGFIPGKGIPIDIHLKESGYFQEINQRQLMSLMIENDLYIQIKCPPSSFLLKGFCIAQVYGASHLDEEFKTKISSAINFYSGQPISVNADYGFLHLSEVALKALSPGINDPGTAVLSIHSLAELFLYRMYKQPKSLYRDDQGVLRIQILPLSFKQLFEKCIFPIWHYGKEDSYIQAALLDMLRQLLKGDHQQKYTRYFEKMIRELDRSRKKPWE
ncbi:MAG: DUF2254 domain-containing protein [Ginsengibacter sp.]